MLSSGIISGHWWEKELKNVIIKREMGTSTRTEDEAGGNTGETQGDTQAKPLRLKDVYGIFIFLVLGHCISSLAWFGELALFRWQVAKKKRN